MNKKKLLSIMLTVFFVLSFSNVAYGEQIQEANIGKVDAPPEINGEIDSFWEQIEANKMTNYIVAIKDNEELDPVKDPEDFSGEWRAAWDDENIYVLVDVTDPIRIGYNYERNGESLERDDSVMIMVGEGYSHINTYFHAATLSSFGAWTNAPQWKVFPHDEILDYAVNDYGDGYIVEVAIPWEFAGINGVTPSVGKTINFDVHAVDNDLGDKMNEIGVEGRYPQSKLTWNDTKNKAHEGSSYLGKVTLLEDVNDTEEVVQNSDIPKTGDMDAKPWVWILTSAAVAFIFFIKFRKPSSQS